MPHGSKLVGGFLAESDPRLTRVLVTRILMTRVLVRSFDMHPDIQEALVRDRIATLRNSSRPSQRGDAVAANRRTPREWVGRFLVDVGLRIGGASVGRPASTSAGSLG
jgi:hypothetical protein